MNRGKAAGKRCRKSDIYIPIILLMPAFLLVVGVIILSNLLCGWTQFPIL